MTDDDLASRAEDLAFARGCENGNECWWDCVAAARATLTEADHAST